VLCGDGDGDGDGSGLPANMSYVPTVLVGDARVYYHVKRTNFSAVLDKFHRPWLQLHHIRHIFIGYIFDVHTKHHPRHQFVEVRAHDSHFRHHTDIPANFQLGDNDVPHNLHGDNINLPTNFLQHGDFPYISPHFHFGDVAYLSADVFELGDNAHLSTYFYLGDDTYIPTNFHIGNVPYLSAIV
jgi:hypothetical protein